MNLKPGGYGEPWNTLMFVFYNNSKTRLCEHAEEINLTNGS